MSIPQMSEPISRSYRVLQVDVFTDRIFQGNPLAVVLDAASLSDAQMQAIAKEMNLSETTFVLPSTRPACVWRIRIFTPGNEMPFAGHPTIGTAFVLQREGLLPAGVREFALEEGIGPVPIRFEGDPAAPTFAWMRQQKATFEPPLTERAAIAVAIGVTEADLLADAPIIVGSTGLPFLYIPLQTRPAVDRVRVDGRALAAALPPGRDLPLFVFAPDPGGKTVYARMLGTDLMGIPEDPATGSASGPLGTYLALHGIATAAEDGTVSIVSEQGTQMGRQSFIHIRLRHDARGPREIEIGGTAVPVMEGTLTVPAVGQ